MKKLLFAAMTAVLTMNAGSADAQTKEACHHPSDYA